MITLKRLSSLLKDSYDDFDENERWTVNVYDSSNNLIDLTTSNNIYKIGSYITQTGNTFYDHYYGTAGNNNGDAVLSDDFGSVLSLL